MIAMEVRVKRRPRPRLTSTSWFALERSAILYHSILTPDLLSRTPTLELVSYLDNSLDGEVSLLRQDQSRHIRRWAERWPSPAAR